MGNDFIRIALVVAIAVLLVYFFNTYLGTNYKIHEPMDAVALTSNSNNKSNGTANMNTTVQNMPVATQPTCADGVAGDNLLENVYGGIVTGATPTSVLGAEVSGDMFSRPQSYCYPTPQLQSDDLLPADNWNEWSKLHPNGEGYLKNRNFLTGGHHIGINTVGNSLRNANLQLRSDPPCPQNRVSPWLNTTIGYDNNRKIFEIGGCPLNGYPSQ